MSMLALLDPSLADYSANPSRNLGDLIIFDAVKPVLEELFPDWNIKRFSSHQPYRDEDCRQINQASLAILGGTNALCSFNGGHSWYQPHEGLFYLFPKIRNNILLGVGWGHGYPNKPGRRMAMFYQRILSKRWLHSVRDEFSRQNLASIGIKNVINTGCPTTWTLNGFPTARTRLDELDCLFTLTDYAKDMKWDNDLIDLLATSAPGRLLFFPQGVGDLEYIQMLASYERHKARIEILERSYESLRRTLSTEKNCFYIGTRLHCGVASLQHGWSALIVSVDNRAEEMGRDCHLPVVGRQELEKAKLWMTGKLDFGFIKIPLDRIEEWKGQFRTCAKS